MATINTIPARQQVVIQQGSPWPGVRVRMTDPDGDPVSPAPTYTAQVRTATIDQGGRLLADCDVTLDEIDAGDKYYSITLDGEVTRTFPCREVYIDVDAQRTGDDTPMVILKLTAQVEGEITVAVV